MKSEKGPQYADALIAKPDLGAVAVESPASWIVVNWPRIGPQAVLHTIQEGFPYLKISNGWKFSCVRW
jgi:hypothetical protein